MDLKHDVLGARMAMPIHPEAGRTPTEHADTELIERAAQWHAQLHSDDSSDHDRIAFEEWLAQHPRHGAVYARIEKLWARFDGLDAGPATSVLQASLTSGKAKSGRPKTRIAALSAFVFAACLAWQAVPVSSLTADYSTSVGELRVIELADHSRITLNTDTAVDVDLSGTQRHITLRQGEISVEVAKDKSRPFIVETEHGTARALGTRYIVRRRADSTDVTVVESSVQACATRTSNCVDLVAGERTTVTNNSVHAPLKIDLQSASSWTRRMLVVDNQPLAGVLRELERYRYGRIYFDADKVADLRVSGVFSLDDTDRTLAVLAGTMPIRVRQYTPLLIVVQAP